VALGGVATQEGCPTLGWSMSLGGRRHGIEVSRAPWKGR
jgi:hypothetical protein